MCYSLLNLEEIKQVEIEINYLLGSSKMTEILEENILISTIGHRKEVFLISNSILLLLNQISSKQDESISKLVHAGIKLGFFIRDKFLIGIESLAYLAPFARRKIRLNQKNTQRFIYGKNIELSKIATKDELKEFKENEFYMVFSDNNIPIGYARIVLQRGNLILENLIDIGIYVRSEKSAF